MNTLYCSKLKVPLKNYLQFLLKFIADCTVLVLLVICWRALCDLFITFRNNSMTFEMIISREFHVLKKSHLKQKIFTKIRHALRK